MQHSNSAWVSHAPTLAAGVAEMFTIANAAYSTLSEDNCCQKKLRTISKGTAILSQYTPEYISFLPNRLHGCRGIKYLSLYQRVSYVARRVPITLGIGSPQRRVAVCSCPVWSTPPTQLRGLKVWRHPLYSIWQVGSRATASK